MSLGSLARRHIDLIKSVLDYLMGILTAVYANLLTMHGFHYRDVRYGNFLVLAFIFIVVLRYKMTRQFSMETQRRVARNILEAAARTLALPKQGREEKFRAACYLYNRRHNTLEHFCHWSSYWHPEFEQPIPRDHPRSEKFVIIRAFNNRRIERKDLEDDERSNLPIEVWKEIRSVLAAPIRDFDDPKRIPLGAISFDSSLTLQQARLDTDQAKEICRIYASSLYELMK